MAFQSNEFIATLNHKPYWPNLNGPTLDPILPDQDEQDSEPPFDFTGVDLDTPLLTPISSGSPTISYPATPDSPPSLEIDPDSPSGLGSSEPTPLNTPQVQVIPEIEIRYNHPFLLFALRNHAPALRIIKNIMNLQMDDEINDRRRRIRFNVHRLEEHLNIYPHLLCIHIRVPRLRQAFY